MLDRLLSLISPHECVVCGHEGAVLCEACTAVLRPAVPRCFRCEQTTDSGWRTCPACFAESGLERVTAGVGYNQAAVKAVVHRLKFDRARAAAADIARRMVEDVPAGQYLIVPVPTAPARARQRGYDQAYLIAHELSRRLPDRCIYAPLLVRRGKTRQLGQSRLARLRQLDDAFRVTKQPPALPILLIDDVITTGATLQAAAAALKARGVRHLEALVFAQA